MPLPISRRAPHGREISAQLRGQVLPLAGWAFVFSCFVNLLMLTGPVFMLQVHDRILTSRSEETLVALIGLVALLYAFMLCLDVARGRVMLRAGARIRSALDRAVFEAGLARARRHAPGQDSARARQDLDAVHAFFASPAVLALMDIPWTPVFLITIFALHPALGWLALGSAALLTGLMAATQILTRTAARKGQDAAARARRLAAQSHLAAELVLAQGMEAALAQRYGAVRSEALGHLVRNGDVAGGLLSLSRALRLFLQSAILALGAFLVLQNEISAGAMVAASILLGRAWAPIEQNLNHWPLIQAAASGWRGLAQDPALSPARAGFDPPLAPNAELVAAGLDLLPPGAARPVLRELQFRLPPGEALGVIGRSGSGKTTLARAVAGLLPPAAGSLRFGGGALAGLSAAQRGEIIGYLPQTVALFSGTVAENIARMAPDPEPQRIVDAARRAGVHEFILSLPSGYDTEVDGLDGRLSVGQRQRIALARALFGGPRLLILDEPNSALDAEGSEALNHAIRETKARGGAVLVMTHRPMAISECDRLMILDGGRITALGPRDEVLKAMVQNAGDIRRTVELRSRP